MGWGFEIGRIYHRRSDIHARFDGQQQGGIITPAKHSVVIIITGEEGLEHGYSDRFRSDGVLEYFGEGQLGDMRMRAGNRAIAEHAKNGKSLLLFRNTTAGVRFEGEMVCEGSHIERAPDRNGVERDAIVFELRSLQAICERNEVEGPRQKESLDELRRRAMDAAVQFSGSAKQALRNVYQRSQDVRDYVLARSNGNCEGCILPAPFCRADGTPYLEPHHLRRLSDGGPDHPAHVIALCPNCHRRVHVGVDGKAYNDYLTARMAVIEVSTGRLDAIRSEESPN